MGGGLVHLGEIDETTVRGSETGSADVERSEVIIEVHMQPLAPCRLRLVTGYFDETNAYATVSRVRRNHFILNPRMHEAVPDDVDEADETIPVSRRHPSEAVFADECVPIVFELAVFERIGMETVDLIIGEVPTPLVSNLCHMGTLRTASSLHSYVPAGTRLPAADLLLEPPPPPIPLLGRVRIVTGLIADGVSHPLVFAHGLPVPLLG